MTTPADNTGHDRCGANKRGGGTCTQKAGWGTDHVGFGKCKLHGGSTPNHRRAAQEAMAVAACERLGVPIETDGISALTNRLWEAEGDLYFYREQVKALGSEVTDEESVGEFGTKTVPNVLVTLYHEAEERSVKIAAECLKAGIEERRLQLDQVRAAEVFRCVAAALGEMGLTDRLEEFRHGFAAALRGGPVSLGAG